MIPIYVFKGEAYFKLSDTGSFGCLVNKTSCKYTDNEGSKYISYKELLLTYAKRGAASPLERLARESDRIHLALKRKEMLKERWDRLERELPSVYKHLYKRTFASDKEEFNIITLALSLSDTYSEKDIYTLIKSERLQKMELMEV